MVFVTLTNCICRDITEIVEPGHGVYHRLIMNEAAELLIIEVQLVHQLQCQVQVDVIRDANQGHQVVLEDQHIMGMARDEGNNIIHRKVCSTNQCDLEILLTYFTKRKSNFCVVVFRFVHTFMIHAHST